MSDTLFEYYNENDDATTTIYGVLWKAMTFTVGNVGADGDHSITSVKLKLYRSAYAPTGGVDCSIYATASGKPTGDPKVTAHVTGEDITTDSGGAWYEFFFDATELTDATKYAIVLSAPGGTSSKWIKWFMDQTSPTYGGGSNCYSGNSGSTWTADTNKDMMFEEYGTTEGGVAHTVTLGETLSLAESLKFDIQMVPTAETLALAESLATQSTFELALDDTITFAEALVAAQTFNLTLADTQTLAESLVAARGLVVGLQDTLNLSETMKHDLGVALADTMALAETIAHAMEYNVALTDTLALSESIAHAIGMYLTETLDLDEDLSVELNVAIRKILKGAMARKLGQPTPINIGVGM
jgi:hypothetical protein